MEPRKRGHVRLDPGRSAALATGLRAARGAAGLSQEALADLAGVTAEHVQRLERGVANPTLATLYALTDAIGVPLTAVLPD